MLMVMFGFWFTLVPVFRFGFMLVLMFLCIFIDIDCRVCIWGAEGVDGTGGIGIDIRTIAGVEGLAYCAPLNGPRAGPKAAPAAVTVGPTNPAEPWFGRMPMTGNRADWSSSAV